MCGRFDFFICFVVFIINFCFIYMFQEHIHQLQGISFRECKNKCDEEANCLSVRYIRPFNLCKMYDVLLNKGIKETGTQVHIKTQKKSETGSNDCEENSLTCDKRICPVPQIGGADMYGNLFDVGSKVQFRCREIIKMVTVECLPSGSWSANTLFCTQEKYSACGYPGTLINGQIGTLSAFNESHARLNVSCDEDYSLHSYGGIFCEMNTGIWSGFENFCCEKLKVLNWTKVLSSKKGVKKEKIVGLKEIVEVCTSGRYNNKHIWLNWENDGIKNINFTVIVNDVAVAYMLFNATGTSRTSWFSGVNLLQSSWSDLQPPLSVQEFSLFGLSEGDRRWFVAKHVGNDTCTEDIGWFVVTWKYYPCNDTTNTGHRILYAKHGRSSRFVQGEIGTADRFEIWIKN